MYRGGDKGNAYVFEFIGFIFLEVGRVPSSLRLSEDSVLGCAHGNRDESPLPSTTQALNSRGYAVDMPPPRIL